MVSASTDPALPRLAVNAGARGFASKEFGLAFAFGVATIGLLPPSRRRVLIGVGVAAWEAVRLMHVLGLRPRRTVRVVLWTNEENGVDGGKAYRDRHLAELRLEGAGVTAALLRVDGLVTGYFYGFDLSSTSTNSNRGEVFYALVPDGDGPFPAVLCPHGHASGGKYSPAGRRDIPEIARQIQEFADAVDRVSTISMEKGRAVKLNIAAGKLTLTVNNPDSGSAEEEMPVEYAHDPIDIGFNARYLLDVASQVKSDHISFLLADAGSPTIVKRRYLDAYTLAKMMGVYHLNAAPLGAPVPIRATEIRPPGRRGRRRFGQMADSAPI